METTPIKDLLILTPNVYENDKTIEKLIQKSE